jgi:hypothetical protein
MLIPMVISINTVHTRMVKHSTTMSAVGRLDRSSFVLPTSLYHCGLSNLRPITLVHPDMQSAQQDGQHPKC